MESTFWKFVCFCFQGYMTKAQKIEDDETSLGKDFGTFKEDFDKFKEDQDLLGEKVCNYHSVSKCPISFVW